MREWKQRNSIQTKSPWKQNNKKYLQYMGPRENTQRKRDIPSNISSPLFSCRILNKATMECLYVNVS